jgi:hypothetical protein
MQCMDYGIDVACADAGHNTALTQVPAQGIDKHSAPRTINSRRSCNISTACCSAVFTARNRIVGRVTAP